MKNLLQVLVVFFFVFSCTKDTFEEPKADDTNLRIADDQFDNSYLGVYKGLFSTNDGVTRGSVVVTLSPTNEALAQITLSSGEMVELKSAKIKLTADNTVSNLRFTSAGLSNIDATLNFSVDADGLNSSITDVNFDNRESNILIAKNLSRAPLTTITGTYVRTAGTGGFPTTPKTWNVMAIGTGNQTYAAQIFYHNRIYTTPPTGTQSGCTDDGTYETCDISGMASILGYDVNWTGTHTYSLGTAANEACSGVSGTWSAPAYGNSSGTFMSDSDCSGPLVSNDTCATAISVGGGTYTGSNLNATNTGAPTSCSNSSILTSGRGVWYSYITPTNKIVTVDTEGTTFAPNTNPDTVLGVFNGSCGSLTCIDYDDDGGSGALSTITFSAMANVTYYFYLTGYNNSDDFGAYTLNVSEITPPANDLCADATPIACGGSVSGTTVDSSTTGVPTATCSGFSFNTAGGVWHTFTVPTTQIVTMDTAGSDFDTKLAVYSGSCGTFTCVTGNDQGTGISPQSLVTFTAVPGTTYYAYVTGFGTATGNYVLNASCMTPPPAPANDLCTNAIAIACGGTVTGSNEGATNVGSPTTTCGTSLASSSTSPGVWYSFTTSTAKAVTLNTIGSSFDTKVAVYSGSCTGLVCVGGNDDGGTGISPQSQIVFNAAANTPYLIYVAGYIGFSSTGIGDITLNVTCTDPPPPVVFSLTPACGTTLVDNGGNSNYGSNRNDTYTIDAGAGNKVSLPFTVFYLESGYDALRIYDGQTTAAPEITNVNGKVTRVVTTNTTGTGFTGTGTAGIYSLQGETVVSTGRYLTLTLKSDGSFQYAGFLATVNCIAARMADNSHQLTNRTFVPAGAPAGPKGTQEFDNPEANKLKVSIEKTKEAERREFEGSISTIQEIEADRIRSNQKNKQ
ncbi:MAG: hypothetical protein ACSHXF_14345 [Aquaticitalea sp.]